MRFKVFVVFMFLGMVYLVYGAGCCVESVTGEYCVGVDSAVQCASGFNDGVDCSQTNACIGGCCDLTQEGGRCYKNMIESRCSGQGGNWDNNQLCLGVEGCENVCCEIGGVNLWTSYGDCNNRNGNVVSDTILQNEVSCVSSNEEGCCADNCRYGYGGGCSEGGFFGNEICSNVIGCKEQITSHVSQGCGDTPETKNDVYYFDSKGNREELIEDCNPPSTSCGDNDDDGNFECESLDCEVTWDNPLTNEDGNGGYRKNGESWCEYQSNVGPGIDLPGTSHYLHSCINGKEVVKNCDPGRNKVCVWDDEDGKGSASCIDNDWEACLDCKRNKACCEDESKLCLFMDTPYSVPGSQPYKDCVPLVPPGNVLDSGDKSDTGRGKGCRKGPTGDGLNKVNYFCNMYGECGADYNLAGEFKNTYFGMKKEAYFGFNDLKNYGKGLYRVGDYDNRRSLLLSGGLAVVYSECLAGCIESDKYNDNFIKCITEKELYCNTLPEYVGAGSDGKCLGVFLYGKVTCSPRDVCLQGGSWKGDRFVPPPQYCSGAKESSLCAAECGKPKGKGRGTQSSNIKKGCGLWLPGYDTDNCERCRKGDLLPDYKFGGGDYECTQELCKSLGSCEWVEDTLEGAACIPKKIGDISPPIVSIDYDAFNYYCNLEIPGDISICNENAQSGLEISDEPKGVTIKGELIDSYEGGNKKGNVTVGIKIDRYSKCKYSTDLSVSFDDMEYDFSDGDLGLSHEETFIDKIGGLDLRDGNEYVIYIRCMSYNDIESGSFFVKFKKAEQPDLSPPVIYRLTFEPETESYVLFGKETELVSFKLNEDAVCRWSKEPDKNYEGMGDEMDCVDNICAGELNVSAGENRYYFRCKDLSTRENTNNADQPYDGYILYGSESNLSIDSVSCIYKLPDGSSVDKCDEVLAKNFSLKVKTIGGAEEGKSRCSYNGNIFFKTDGKEHEQCIGCGGEQYLLQEGSYQYRISCIDAAGNEDYSELNTFLKIDYRAPKIERYYIKNNLLNVETNEPSYCRYTNTFNINYNTATDMASSDRLTHSTSASRDFYKIQCKDRFDNKMAPVNIYLSYI